jgi:hypothetical protein
MVKEKEPMRFGPGASDIGPEQLEHMNKYIRRYNPLWRGNRDGPMLPKNRIGQTIVIICGVVATYFMLIVLLWQAMIK